MPKNTTSIVRKTDSEAKRTRSGNCRLSDLSPKKHCAGQCDMHLGNIFDVVAFSLGNIYNFVFG